MALGQEVKLVVTNVSQVLNVVDVDGTTKESEKDVPAHVTFGRLSEDKAYQERLQALSPGDTITVKSAKWNQMDGEYYAMNILTKSNLI